MMKTAATIGSLSSSTRFKNHLQAVEAAITTNNQSTDLLDETCSFLTEIDSELHATHRFIIEYYASKFPELETLLTIPRDYVLVVQRIGNGMDLSSIPLTDLLSNRLIMVINVAGSTTSGMPLSPDRLAILQSACTDYLGLDSQKARFLTYLEMVLNRIAPNLVALLGSAVTAQLISLTGGLEALVKIPSCNLQVLGQEKRNLMGMSGISTMPHAGILSAADLVTSAPPDLRKVAVKTLAAKVALAARIDLARGKSALPSAAIDDTEGCRLRSEILSKLDKLQEPDKARTKRALPAPIEVKKARRGGKRVRAQRARLETTELQKAANRQQTEFIGEYGDSAMGMAVGNVASGRIEGMRKKAVKSGFLKTHGTGSSGGGGSGGSSGATGGLSSSLVFTPVQGLELVDPEAKKRRLEEVNAKWFGNSGFMSAKPRA